MPPNLRLSLTIFSAGFGIETVVDAERVLPGNMTLVPSGVLFLVGSLATVLGLLFLWVGRHEWNELHRARVRHAHVSFALVLALGVAGAGPPSYYAVVAGATPPSWLGSEVGIAIAGAIFVTFVMYALIAYHLVGSRAKAILAVAVLASIPVAGWVGLSVAANLGTYLAAARTSPSSIVTLVEPIVSLFSYLFLSYLLLFVAFVDAHRRVARGLGPVAAWTPGAAPPVRSSP